MTKVSVVTPTYNRWEQLSRTLQGLAAQSYPHADFEVVVVSDGSTDGTNERVLAGETAMPVRFVQQENQGPAAARNAGVAAADGDLLVFIDDDVVPEPECIDVHVAAHAGGDTPVVVIGPLLTPVGTQLLPWVKWEQAMLYKQYDAMARGDYQATARQFYTGNASLARRTFRQAGGFDGRFRRAEDVELAYRLERHGVGFIFEPAARAYHHAERSFESWLAVAAAYGRNDVVFARDLGYDWLLSAMREEYGRRNVLTRLFLRVGLVVPPLRRLARDGARPWAKAMDALRFPGAGRRALSAVYNDEYYTNVCAEFGSMRRFLHDEPLNT